MHKLRVGFVGTRFAGLDGVSLEAANAVGPFLDEAFPPGGSSLSHLVINSLAARELRRRKGMTARLLPNIMNFERPPPPGDAAGFRAAAGLSDSDLVILQATRMIPRKRIEDTLELASRLRDDTIRVVVTHPEPDEGDTNYGSAIEAEPELTDFFARFEDWLLTTGLVRHDFTTRPAWQVYLDQLDG